MLGMDAVVGVGEVAVPGIEVRGSFEVEIDGFTFRRSDFTFSTEARVDLEAVATGAPARWAVSALAQAPGDRRRQERAAAAVRAAGVVIPEESAGHFDLTAVRISGGRMLGALLVLIGPEASGADRFAYLLTPDLALADEFAGRRGRLAGAFVDVLCPLDEDPDVEGIFDYRARIASEQFLSRLPMSGPLAEGEPEPGPSIVRAVRGSAPVEGPRVRQRHRAPAAAGSSRGQAPGALQGVYRRLVHGEPFARRLLREENAAHPH